MSLRNHFVCRSCLLSLRAAQQRPARQPWTATAALPPTAPPPTATIGVRTMTRMAAGARSRTTRRSDSPTRRQAPPRQQGARPLPGQAGSPAGPHAREPEAFTLPSMGELFAATEADPKNEYGRDEDVRVKYFDQEADGSLQPTTYSGFSTKEEELLGQIQEKIDKTSKTVKDMKESGGAGRRRPTRYDMIRQVEAEAEELEAMEQELLETRRAERRAERKGTAEIANAVDTVDTTDDVRIADTGLTANARRHVKNLNNILRPAARRLQGKGGGVDSKIITALWSRYGAARTGLAEAWANVPPAVWSTLWTVLAWDDEGKPAVRNPQRMSHVYFLAKDMQAAGVALTDAQQLLAMEAMFVEGWPAAALENWRRGATTLGVRPATAVDFWELGVRMCALQGELERAERAAERLFSSEFEALLEQVAKTAQKNKGYKTRGDPRVLFQLIRSAAAKDDKDRAWATYRRLRALVDQQQGPQGMAIEDYDQVVSCFLTANHTEYAFDVFVDMMFSGALDLHQQRLQQSGARKTASGQRVRLPSAVANHFFFGKWLKRLIGAGDLDGAYRVLQFMQACGVMTASVQVNGLLGAWLRSGTAANQARADALAWRMVESRRLFVDLRRREQAVEWPLQLRTGALTAREVAGAEAGPDLTFVPRATTETFLLMADNYKNRGQLAQLQQLWEAFRACEMPLSDAFMMNQLLESYVHDGRADDARALYRDLVRGPQRVVPNAHTFLVLFKSLAVHRTVARTMDDDERRAAWQDARQLVAEMGRLARVAFVPGSRSGAVDAREAVFFQALGRMVLHTFRKTGDYVGLCVLLQTLRPLLAIGTDAADAGQRRFHMTDSLAVELIAETSELNRDSPATRHRILKAGDVVEALLREVQRRQLKVHGWHVGDGAMHGAGSSAVHLSDDLAAVVAHVYRVKCEGVDEADFALMYAAAVDELGVRALL